MQESKDTEEPTHSRRRCLGQYSPSSQLRKELDDYVLSISETEYAQHVEKTDGIESPCPSPQQTAIEQGKKEGLIDALHNPWIKTTLNTVGRIILWCFLCSAAISFYQKTFTTPFTLTPLTHLFSLQDLVPPTTPAQSDHSITNQTLQALLNITSSIASTISDSEQAEALFYSFQHAEKRIASAARAIARSDIPSSLHISQNLNNFVTDMYSNSRALQRFNEARQESVHGVKALLEFRYHLSLKWADKVIRARLWFQRWKIARNGEDVALESVYRHTLVLIDDMLKELKKPTSTAEALNGHFRTLNESLEQINRTCQASIQTLSPKKSTWWFTSKPNPEAQASLKFLKQQTQSFTTFALAHVLTVNLLEHALRQYKQLNADLRDLGDRLKEFGPRNAFDVTDLDLITQEIELMLSRLGEAQERARGRCVWIRVRVDRTGYPFPLIDGSRRRTMYRKVGADEGFEKEGVG